MDAAAELPPVAEERKGGRGNEVMRVDGKEIDFVPRKSNHKKVVSFWSQGGVKEVHLVRFQYPLFSIVE